MTPAPRSLSHVVDSGNALTLRSRSPPDRAGLPHFNMRYLVAMSARPCHVQWAFGRACPISQHYVHVSDVSPAFQVPSKLFDGPSIYHQEHSLLHIPPHPSPPANHFSPRVSLRFLYSGTVKPILRQSSHLYPRPASQFQASTSVILFCSPGLPYSVILYPICVMFIEKGVPPVCIRIRSVSHCYKP